MRTSPHVLRRLVPVVVATVVAACSSTPTPTITEVPVAVAEPVPFEGSGLEPRATPTPSPVPTPSPTPEVTDPPTEPRDPGDDDTVLTGPTSADAARFVAGDDPEGISGLQHVVVDLDGDGWSEVVATGMRDRVGVLRVAWWSMDRYEVLATVEAGRGSRIADLRVADVNRDERIEVLVEVGGDGRQSLALWSVADRGRLEALEAVGGCNDGSHVYGVTRARLASQQDAPPVIVADCDESPLPVADWAEHRWAWQDGAYRWLEPPRPDPGPPDGPGSEDPPGGGPGSGPGSPGDGDDDDGDDGDDEGPGNSGGRGSSN